MLSYWVLGCDTVINVDHTIFSGHSHGVGGGHGHSHGKTTDKNVSNNMDSKSLIDKPMAPSQNTDEYDENNPVWEITPEKEENANKENDPNDIIIEFDEKRLCKSTFEPAHEVMALFVLHTLILQTRMRNHPVGLDV